MVAVSPRWAVLPWLAALLALPVVAWLDPPRRNAGSDVYTIPAGTAARVAAGDEAPDALPQRVVTRVGHALEVVNDDSVAHTFGPFVLAPGQRWVRRFAQPGKVRVACSVFPAADFVIQVDPAEARGGLSDTVRTAAVVVWAGLVALVAAGLGAAVLGTVAGLGAATGPGSAAASRLAAGSGSAAGRRAAAGMDAAMPLGMVHRGLALARTASAALPGAAVVALASAVLAMSRVVPWPTALASGSARAWVLDVVLWGVAAAVVGSLEMPGAVVGDRDNAAGRDPGAAGRGDESGGIGTAPAAGDRAVFVAVALFALAVALMAGWLGLWADGWWRG